MIKKRLFTTILAGLLLLSVIPVLAISERESDTDINAAPDFVIETLNAGEITLSDFAGDVVILSFWAVWDESVTDITTTLQTFHETFAEQGYQVISVHHPLDTDADLRDLIDEVGITLPVGIDETGIILSQYRVERFPHTVVIDSDGSIAGIHFEMGTVDDLVAIVNEDLGSDLVMGTDEAPETDTTPDSDDSVDAPLPRNVETRYEDLTQQVTEAGFPRLGSPSALAEIIYYGSFSCSFCQDFHRNTFLPLLEDMREEEVALIYVPISNTGEIPNGYAANHAALCAGEQNSFWEYADTLYYWHDEFGTAAFENDRLRAGVVNLGLDVEQWENCMAEDRMSEVLDTASEQMRDGGYPGTPTVVIAGEEISASYSAIQDFLDTLSGNQT